MKGGACQSVQTSDDKRIAFSDVFEGTLPIWGSFPDYFRFFFLKDFVAIFQLTNLNIKALSDRTYPRITYK